MNVIPNGGTNGPAIPTAESAKRPSLDIIIVNWNTGGLLRECLRSLAKTPRCFSRVVVVDNASTDDSMKDWPDGYDLPLVVIRNHTNRGFAAACNQGARGSQADYLLFLNPDTRLFAQSLLQPLAFMEDPRHSSVGIVGIQLINEQGEILRTCARFPTHLTYVFKILGLDRVPRFKAFNQFMLDWDHKECRVVDQVMGAFFLTRRYVFESLGGFDERFFVYFEDVEFSLRVSRAGWSTYFLAEAQAYHQGHGSSSKAKPARLFYSLRSRIHYAYKHFSWLSATTLLVETLLIEPMARLALAVWHRSGDEAADTLEAYALLWAHIPAIFRERRRRETALTRTQGM